MSTTDDQLDAIYDRIDALLRAGDFAAVGVVLAMSLSNPPPIDEAIALLTATLPAKSKLLLRIPRTALLRMTAERIGKEQLKGLE